MNFFIVLKNRLFCKSCRKTHCILCYKAGLISAWK